MRINQSLFCEAEPPIHHALSSPTTVVAHNFELIQFLHQEYQYYDEPKLQSFSARITSKQIKHDGLRFEDQASGFSFFSKKEAVFKCLMESIERYCNFVFNKSSVECIDSPRRLFKKGINFDLLQKSRENFDDNIRFCWTRCESLSGGNFLLVPCQSIWLAYPYLPNEPVIYPPISTGVAAGGCLSAALLRGLLEVIERDAFIIYYLQKLPAPKIKLELIKNNQVMKLLETVKRYKLEVHCFDISTDIGIPVVVSIVLDRTGVGKAVSVGLKSDLSTIKAIVGSITEAFHTRKWIRTEHERNQAPVSQNDLLKNSSLTTRGLLWYSIDSIKHLDFWLNSSQTKIVKEEGVSMSSGEELKRVIHVLIKSGYTPYWKNLMISQFDNLNIYVVKTMVPGFQPLYLNENYRLAVSDRLYEVPEKLGFKTKRESQLNTFPHPFL